MRKTGLGSALALTLALGVAGCSGDSDDKSSREKKKTAESSSPSSVDPDKTSPDDLQKSPIMKKGWEGAFKDVKFGECPTKNGPVKIDATVTNPTDKAQDYAIVVSWINGSNDVLGRAVKSVKALGPDQSRDIVLATKLKAPVKVTCTFNVSRGTLARG